MTSYVLSIDDDMAKQRLIRNLQASPIRDTKGRLMTVTIVREQIARSLNQNNTWHGWLAIMAAHAGCTFGEMKRAVKKELLQPVESIDPLTGEITMVPRGTSGMSKEEFTHLMRNTEILAKEHFQIQLPAPDDPAAWKAYRHTKHAASAA